MTHASVVHGPPVPARVWQPAHAAVLRAERVGYRVAIDVAERGRVHSSFRRACNVAFGAVLLTLAIDEAGAGPTRLELADDTPRDLRALFRVGDAVRSHADALYTERAVVRWRQAPVWRPIAAPLAADRTTIDARLTAAGRRLRERATDWCDGTGELPQALGAACRRDDQREAAAIARRLLGRGEGLTPAGDDFLAGLLAALDLAGTDLAGRVVIPSRDVAEPDLHRGAAFDDRRALRAAIVQAVVADLPRTTAISAQGLRLAADAHHGERLLALRDALITRDGAARVAPALDALLRVGASSGAALAAGLLAGIGACLRCEALAAAA